jgi:4'-phosphopantetheinyl transferase
MAMWSPAHVPLLPDPAEVHVWACGLELGDERAARLRSWLSRDELGREARFHRQADRRRFAVAHGLLRWVLARYVGRPAAEITFPAGIAGKPEAEGPVRFSFSHSADLALVAVGSDAELGVDVERVRPVGDRAAAAELVLTPDARAALGSDVAFLRAWSRREAYVKGRGDGLFARDEADRPEARAAWTVLDLDPAPGYVGALAVRGPVPRVRWERVPA